MRVVTLGLDHAGKTSILFKLKQNEFIQTIPTIGKEYFLTVPIERFYIKYIYKQYALLIIMSTAYRFLSSNLMFKNMQNKEIRNDCL